MSAVLDSRSFLRWCWRQLTSMRIALILLLLLAVAAIPGSLFPQRNQNPIQVKQFLLITLRLQFGLIDLVCLKCLVHPGLAQFICCYSFP